MEPRAPSSKEVRDVRYECIEPDGIFNPQAVKMIIDIAPALQTLGFLCWRRDECFSERIRAAFDEFRNVERFSYCSRCRKIYCAPKRKDAKPNPCICAATTVERQSCHDSGSSRR